MAKYRNYVIAQSLEEAYALNQKKSSVIVAGNMWLRMCGLNKQKAIDLSALGLDGIVEMEDAFVVGAMAPLRAMETHEGLNRAFGGAFKKAFAPIVGTQFRNMATVGASVYSRFGFSDVSALLLALNAEVILYKRGAVKLAEYQKEAWDRDIVVQIRIPKGQCAAVQSVRVSATDIPTLVCAASKSDAGMRIVLGARPARAVVVAEGLAPDAPQRVYEEIASQVTFGTNLRASDTYRKKIAPVLMARAVKACQEVAADER
ncbi:MAG: FAD binding domain-containing protein [Clostridia bacterium]|nr:FAD binding domain-containing protein [Clostridia bacterium]